MESSWSSVNVLNQSQQNVVNIGHQQAIQNYIRTWIILVAHFYSTIKMAQAKDDSK